MIYYRIERAYAGFAKCLEDLMKMIYYRIESLQLDYCALLK